MNNQHSLEQKAHPQGWAFLLFWIMRGAQVWSCRDRRERGVCAAGSRRARGFQSELSDAGFSGRGLHGAGFPAWGFPPAQGFRARGFLGAGFPGTGFPGAGLHGAGFLGAGFPGANFPGTEFPGQASRCVTLQRRLLLRGLPGMGFTAQASRRRASRRRLPAAPPLPGAGLHSAPPLPGRRFSRQARGRWRTGLFRTPRPVRARQNAAAFFCAAARVILGFRLSRRWLQRRAASRRARWP